MLLIRDAEQEEYDFIRKQRIDAYAEHAAVLPEEHWHGLREAISSDADTLPGTEIIVAELEGRIVGSVVLFPPKTDAYKGYVEELDYPEIRMLAVAPEVRGSGAGKALVSECILRAQDKGFSHIGLHTGEFMKEAISLYEFFGFERIPQYDFEPVDDGIIVKAFRRAVKEDGE